MPFSLLFLGFLVFTIKFPSASRGLIIAPVTGSRGNGFGPIFAPVVGAFGAFSLFDEFVDQIKKMLMQSFCFMGPNMQTLPLENVTNILNSASSLLPQTSTTKPSTTEKAPKAPTTGAKRGPKKKPRDPVTGKIIRPVDSDGNIIVQARKPRNNKENAK